MAVRVLDKKVVEPNRSRRPRREVPVAKFIIDDKVDRKRLPKRYSRGYWPLTGASVACAATIATAAIVGAPEVMLGLSVGYATYEIMRHRMGLLKALQAASRLERLFFTP